MPSMWPPLRSRDSSLAFVAGALPAGVAHSRGSEATGFNERGILTTYASGAPVFDYDPALLYNHLVDPGCESGTIGAALPAGWTAGGAGISGTLVARGTTADGLPFFRVRFAGTTSNTQAIVLAPGVRANRECPVATGEVASCWARVALVSAALPVGSMVASARFVEFNDTASTSVANIAGTLTLGVPFTYQRTLTAANASTTNAAPAILLSGHTSGQAIDVTVEMIFPVATRGTRPATDYATPQELAAKDAYGRIYGRRGLLTEPASTNLDTNPRNEGGGTGTPGTLPTGVTINVPAPNLGTVVQSIVTAGVAEDGIGCFDLRFAGTPTGPVAIELYLGPSEATGLATGDKFAAASFARLVGGTIDNVVFRETIQESTGAGYYGETAAPFVPDGTPLRQQRHPVVHTLASATPTGVRHVLRITLAAGAVDFTLRIGGQQHEKLAFITSLIQPPVAAPAASARSATIVSLAAYAAAAMATDTERVLELSVELVPGTHGWLLWNYGPTVTDRDELWIDSANGQLTYRVVRDNVQRQYNLHGPTGVNQRRFLTVAIQQKRNGYGASLQGADPTLYARDFAIPGTADLRLCRQNSVAQPAAWIRRFRHWHDAGDRLDTVNVGTAPDDGAGDPLRVAYTKTQAAMVDAAAALAAAPSIGDTAPGRLMDGGAGFPTAASYLEAARAIWWLSLSGADDAAIWTPLGNIDHPGYLAGRWYGANNSAIGSTSTQAAGFIYFSAHYIAHQVTLDRLAVAVGATTPDGKRIRLGIYASDPSTGEPGALLLDPAADLAPASAAQAYALSLPAPITLAPGIYWFACCCEGTPNLRGDAHNVIQGGGPAVLRGSGTAIFAMMASGQSASTQSRVVSRAKYEFRPGVAFLPAMAGDVLGATNIPTSPYVAWRAA